MMGIGSLMFFALFAASILTGLLRQYALTANLMDIPNQRSSHIQPTPRAGGVAIIIIFLLGLPVLAAMGLLSYETLWALWGAGAIVAIVGFMDDHQHIPARWRLLVHIAGASWGLYGLGGLPPLALLNQSLLDLGWFGHFLALFLLVWMINLYNFMDGIDGLAGIEAITVCLGGVLLFLISDTSSLWEEPALLAMAVAGFLLWNFPPAKIFMGDAGSGFIGILLGLFSIQAAWIAPQFFWSYLILLGVFIVDATLTLFRRYFHHEKVYEAHCSHAYQNAARIYQAHKPVSLAIGAINLCWLLPLAIWVGLGGLNGFWGLVIAYFPLLLLAMHFRAGVRNTEQ